MNNDTREIIKKIITIMAAAMVLFAAGGPFGLVLCVIYVLVEYC